MENQYVTIPDSVPSLIAIRLCEATGRSREEIETSGDLSTLDGINSIVIADVIDSVEDTTGLLADAALMNKDSFRTVSRISEIFT
ncbi:hypothetical protein [Actinoplanes philippinensis]|uniref:hypothetical protein n=1 Tax=Actinoplanes philippinensis TaxID=35752 RepID=UPI0033E5493C